jgi:hypothetical protein
VLDNITLDWLTNTPIASARLYWEGKLAFFAPKNVAIPVAVSLFPDDLYAAPRSWVERAYPKLIHYNRACGGATRRRIAMTTVDRVFGWLLVAGGLLHALGSWDGYWSSPETLLWALAGSLAALLLAAVNLLRVGRPGDRRLAWVSFWGCIAWLAVALGFGKVIGIILDPRALIHAINAAVLAGMSLRTVVRAASQPA